MTTNTEIQTITERVAREGEIPPVGTYLVEGSNYLEVKRSSKGTKGLSLGFMIQSDAKTGKDASGYSMQKYNIWTLSGVLEGNSKKDGRPYRIDNAANLVTDFARIGFDAAAIEALTAKIDAANPEVNAPVTIFGSEAPALIDANGSVVSLKGKQFKVTVTHEEYNGRTSAKFKISKAIASK
jgi:hypothetical protein